MCSESPSLSPLTPGEYLKDRVDFKIEAYRKKGMRYRWGYLGTASVSAIAAATVPVLINLEGVAPIVPTLLSLLVTILVGLEGLFHLREHWKNYDMMKSVLRQEVNLFRASAGPYREKSIPAESFVLLVERIEEEISKERAQTIQMRTARGSEHEELRKPTVADTPAQPRDRAAELSVTADAPQGARR